jgi:hypothetical protein
LREDFLKPQPWPTPLVAGICFIVFPSLLLLVEREETIPAETSAYLLIHKQQTDDEVLLPITSQ